MNQAINIIPPYVDTETPAVRWYTFHGLIALFSLGMAGIAALLLEYEMAKLAHPQASFYITPSKFDIVVSGIVIALAIMNLSTLIFVFMRHLWLRRWMLGTTIAGWVLIAILVVVLSYSFLPIILPWYR